MTTPRRVSLSIGLLAFVCEGAFAQETTRSSLKSNGGQANDHSFAVVISSDGRFVVFNSDATNLVSNDTNQRRDVFVRDRDLGMTERVSVSSAGAEADDDCYGWSISADGRLVAFGSFATNLVSGDTNNMADVFVHDRTTGATELVSVNTSGAPGNGDSFTPSISLDGRFVAFSSSSSDLVASDSNANYDIFVRDLKNGTTELISVDTAGVQANGASGFPVISWDGDIIAFSSDSTNLVPGDNNLVMDVFVRDRSIGMTERVSVDSSGNEANDASFFPSVSADGGVVAFESAAWNLIPGDGNGYHDVFVHDRNSGITECVSINSAGITGNGDCRLPNSTVSADGRFVTFSSRASDLVAVDTNGREDAFLRDRAAGATEIISVDSSGVQGNDGSNVPSVSANGEHIAFSSSSTNLVPNDTNGKVDAFVRDRCDAIWLNYGVGFPGTNGIPAFTARSDPVLGSTLSLDLDNASGNYTIAVLLIGFQRTDLSTAKGGELLVVPTFLFWFPLPPGTTTFTGTLPSDPSLCAFAVDLQAFEADAGAAKGVAFTQGLELILGN